MYFWQKRIDLPLGLVTAAVTVPCAFIGAYLTSYVSSDQLSLIFGIALIAAASKFIIGSIHGGSGKIGEGG